MYKDFAEVKDLFLNGHFKFTNEIVIGNISFIITDSSETSFADVILNNQKCYIIYSAGGHKKEAKAAGLNEWVVFLWGEREGDNHVVPYSVKLSSKAHIRHDINEQDGNDDKNIIGDSVDIKFTSLTNSPPIKGKVDTGAEMSSLHADRYTVNKETKKVSFVNKDLSPNVLTVDLIDHQPIRSADGGTEYRPVIRLDVKINDKVIPDVAFNLNNRSSMEFSVLIGQNILEKGKFLINPMQEGETLEEKQDGWDEDEIPPFDSEAYAAFIENYFDSSTRETEDHGST